MAIYRSDQATVTFAPEVGQGGYMESGDSTSLINTGLGISSAVSPGDRTVTLTSAFNGHTGTAAQSGTTVTGSSTAFTDTMIGYTFTFSTGTGGGIISAVAGTTALTVSSSVTVTSTSFKIEPVSGGANLKTFIAIGNNTSLSGPKEIRRLVSGYGTATLTVDTPFGFPHPAIVAGAGLVEFMRTKDDGTADAVQTDDKGKFITWFPGVYESVDCPDPEQAFEPRYVLGSLTNRNFYEMYAGNETLTGSLGGMVMLNGFPLRFPIGKVVTTPVTASTDSVWDLNGAAKAGATFIALEKSNTANATALAVGDKILFGVAAGGSDPSGSSHITDSTQVYEIRDVVTDVAAGATGTVQIWPPLSFDHPANEDIYIVAGTEFLHTIFEQVALTPLTWNVNIVDDAGTNSWQRRYVGGKVGSMTLSAESGGLLTGGWDGVNFLDMLHNMKSHPALPANQPMPRYTSMQNIVATKVGTYNSSGTFDRPATAPFYYSQGSIKMFGATASSESELARVGSFNLSISNSTEPKYYVGSQYDGRRAPKEQFEGQREYSMSASIAMSDSVDQGADDSKNLYKELLLAGDYRGTTGATGFRGFSVQLKFVRDIDGDSNDYIKIDIPGDGTAARGGNEQGAFIRTAPHNIGEDSPIMVDADIIFRDMSIKIRDTEPIYP